MARYLEKRLRDLHTEFRERALVFEAVEPYVASPEMAWGMSGVYRECARLLAEALGDADVAAVAPEGRR